MKDHYPEQSSAPEKSKTRDFLDATNDFFAQVLPTMNQDALRNSLGDTTSYYYAVLNAALDQIDADENSPLRKALEDYVVAAFHTDDPHLSGLIYDQRLGGIIMIGQDGELAALTGAQTHRLSNGQAMVRRYESAVPMTGPQKGQHLNADEYPIPLPRSER